MRLLRRCSDLMVFHLGKREHEVLLEMLKMYPLVPPAHHRISSDTAPNPNPEPQRLLDEALTEQREENRKQIQALLTEPYCRLSPETGWELTLKAAHAECLLQALNDVRVGSWLHLGEPETESLPTLTPENLRFLAALEVCGLFQSVLLGALGVEQSPDWR